MRIPIINWSCVPDTSGTVYVANFSEFATNDFWPRLVLGYTDTPTLKWIAGGFAVPSNYGTNAAFVVHWTTSATTGNVVWTAEYRVIPANDTTSLDQATSQEIISLTRNAPAAAFNALQGTLSSVSPTNFVAERQVEFSLARNGADAADNMAATALVFDLFFQYDPA